MTAKLLYKELRLAAHPNLYVFLFMGALLLIPAYPYSVVFLFGVLGPTITVFYSRETQDILYTALLPLPKRYTVLGKCALFAIFQLSLLALSVPFALLKVRLVPADNPVGLNANLTFYALALLTFAAFNLVFLPVFFKSAYKAGRAFLLAGIPLILGMGITEAIGHIPALAVLGSTAPQNLLRQLPLLAAALILYGAATCLTYKRAAKNYSAVDL